MGMQFAAILEPICKDGKIKTEGNEIVIKNATECWLKISSATNYNYGNGLLSNENVVVKSMSYLQKTKNISYSYAFQKSKEAYQKLFNRCRWYMPAYKKIHHHKHTAAAIHNCRCCILILEGTCSSHHPGRVYCLQTCRGFGLQNIKPHGTAIITST